MSLWGHDEKPWIPPGRCGLIVDENRIAAELGESPLPGHRRVHFVRIYWGGKPPVHTPDRHERDDLSLHERQYVLLILERRDAYLLDRKVAVQETSCVESEFRGYDHRPPCRQILDDPITREIA